MPKAYWVSLYSEVHDPEKLATYVNTRSSRDRGGRWALPLSRGNAAYAFENGKIQRMVVIEFPSLEAAHGAHESAAYHEALAALDDGASRDLRIIEGIE